MLSFFKIIIKTCYIYTCLFSLASDMSNEEIKRQILLQDLKYKKARAIAMQEEANMKKYIALYYKNKGDAENVQKLEASIAKSNWQELYNDIRATIQTGLAD